MELFYSSDIQGSIVRLDSVESGHLVRVLRHKAGDEISVIDGKGSLYRCTLLNADAKEAEAQVIERVYPFGSHPYHLTLAVCPTKNNDRYEWFAQKATEFGIDRIVPTIGEHSERRVFKTDRIGKIVLAATKQSLKASLPHIDEPMSVKQFISSCADSKALKLICYCSDELAQRTSIKEALESLGDNREIIVLIGPEGDFSQGEVRAAMDSGWVPVQLGESRFRTETAALAATAAVYFHFL
ncbi:MAG: 16S rRNA (uracil(1498)-N(3))-methyltransferase [Bacteroidales bacterium]|nr:16S rRNA (uracil(1498)-N(3))-methyltransferase [Bacteroidales bacterium]MBQ2006135.1 16S rRNA (uracil(1498)-N(3))-methyltransferase [Bacteroidales bacterium]MBQ5582939.1 16S rRNA (uracil(1498)-N(3))-methyltransferase [Bacteroidales bacterium]